MIKVEMGRTAAVGRAETRQRGVSPPALRMYRCPLMFASDLVIGVPYFANAQVRSQVIQVPVGPAGKAEMVFEAGLQTTRTEGTADIYVKAGFKEEGAESADGDRFFYGASKNQAIGAGKRVHGR